jgi:hypothetical protein
MSVIIFFSESKQLFFCRNDVQALDFLRKGSYAPDKAHFSIGKKNKRSTNKLCGTRSLFDMAVSIAD